MFVLLIHTYVDVYVCIVDTYICSYSNEKTLFRTSQESWTHCVHIESQMLDIPREKTSSIIKLSTSNCVLSSTFRDS